MTTARQHPGIHIPALPEQKFGIQHIVGDDIYISKDILDARAESANFSVKVSGFAWNALCHFDERIKNMMEQGIPESPYRIERKYAAAAEQGIRLFCQDGDLASFKDFPAIRPLMSIRGVDHLISVPLCAEVSGIGDRSVALLNNVVGVYITPEERYLSRHS